MIKATQQQTKAHNRSLLLQLVYDRQQVSRAELARLTGLTRTTVSGLVAELIQDELVGEVGLGPSIGGKPPTLLQIVADSRSLLGVDLASHEFHGAVVNLRGQVQYRYSIPLKGDAEVDPLERVYELVDGLLPMCKSPILGIGIGTPGLVNSEQGIVRYSVNLDWRNLPLGANLKERYHLPVCVANDCQAAALAETTFGANKNTPNLIVVKVGRGIGSGIVLNGRLYGGYDFCGGEIGHMVISDEDVDCRCGHKGCLEAVASSQAILTRVQAAFSSSPVLSQMVHSPQEVDLQVLINAYHAGDTLILSELKRIGMYLGIAFANLVSVLNIHKIVLAGSLVVGASDGIIPSAYETMWNRSLDLLGKEMVLETSRLGNDIVVLGAAALLMQAELGLV